MRGRLLATATKMPPPRRFKAIKLAILMMCVGMLASGCTKMMTKDDVSEERRYRIQVRALEECSIDFNLIGSDIDVRHGDSTEFKPDGAMLGK